MSVVETGDRYDNIPDSLFQGSRSLLDIGNCGGVNFLASRHASHLKHCQYLGVDIAPPEPSPLPTVTDDIIHWQPSQQYDLIMALHIIEHIPLNLWQPLIEKLKACTRKFLVIGVPYDEPERFSFIYADEPSHMQHKVYNITKTVLSQYLLPEARFSLHTVNNFNSDGANILWATLRLVKRIMTRHHYARQRRLLAIWEKNDHVELSPDTAFGEVLFTPLDVDFTRGEAEA